MSTKINPPLYNPKIKSYELFKQELLAWKEVTELDKKKQGVAIALSLPENDESQIREKVFDQLNLEDLKKETGLKTLIEFLDKHLAKDDLADSLEKFEDFEDFKRSDGQSVNEYISIFDAKYRKIEKKNMKLPPEILAFKLLKRSQISKEERMIVLTGMNFENKETLYEEAKKSLKKFKGETCEGHSSSTPMSIKLEPAFLAENEEALMAAGYARMRNNKFYRGGGRSEQMRGRGFQSGQSRGFYRGQHGGQSRAGSSAVKKSMNPSGPDGNVLTCKSCGSYRHLMAACPHSWENMAKVNACSTEEEEFVLFTGYQPKEIRHLGMEARNCAVLDSACSSTVCGSAWINTYIDSLNDLDKNRVKKTEGRKMFKFGGGTRLKSEGEFAIPARIAGKDVTIITDVVDSDIPLLLSRTAMKTAGVKLNLEDDTAEILGKTMNLNVTSSGHYCIPIDKAEMIPVEEVCSVRIDDVDPKKRYSTLLKLHRQFAHPPKKRLVSLLQDAGAWRDNFDEDLEKIEERCDVCKTYARTPSRPVVSFPMATYFNEKVAMDLKYWRGKWILHLIDMWSRYTISIFIQRKKTTDVIDKIMSHWIGIFGVMGAIMTDNGGEFNSDEMREVASILNVKVCTSAGESPFQNGLCERVHSVTDMMLTKLEQDYKDVNEQSLLCWANMARNVLQMWNGFSSHQLVFGWNPNLPNIMTDKLPALEGRTVSETFAKHLNLLHSTRRAYIEAEADERIRRALLNKVRAAEQCYENGDLVYYKREGRDRWLGPGRVVFQDGKVVFVRHGGVFVRVSPNRLQKATAGCTQVEEKISDTETTGTNKERTPHQGKASEKQLKKCTVSEYLSENKEEQKLPLPPQRNFALKTNDNIQYKMGSEDENWIKATILGRAGKASGNNRNWYNVKDVESEEQKSIDLSRLPWERISDECVNSTTCENTSCDNISLAKQNELEKLKNFDTYTEVLDEGQNRLSTRWVITSKEEQVRARLVARGFEEEFDIPRDSPTVGKGGLKIFLTITASKFWDVKTTDIKSAFLQGKKLDRDVYLQPPKESITPVGMIWKLKHCLYGLKDGARQFYLSVKEELDKLGFEQCSVDPALFCYRKDGRLHGIICSHVDDFLHAGDEIFEGQICRFRERFSAGKIAECQFPYIGFYVKQTKEGIELDHTSYMEKLQSIEIDPLRAYQKESQLSTEEQTAYRQIIGQINWAVQGSRPDLAFEMIDMSTKLRSGNMADLIRATKTINRLKDFKSILRFPALDLTSVKIMTFTDASLGNLNDGVGSTQGVIIWIMDRQGKCCPLFWQAKKIRRVVRSTLAAEALSLQEGLEASFYYRHMLEEILGVPSKSIEIYAFIDNKSVIESVHSTKLVEDRRLRIDIAALTEAVTQGDVRKIQWCSGQKQLANCLTKAGANGLCVLKILQTGRMLPDFVF